MKSYPPDRTAWVIFSVPQQWLQLSVVLVLCSLVAGMRLGNCVKYILVEMIL